jgi:predicted phosphoribosyltransferase/dienelactone hydrolase
VPFANRVDAGRRLAPLLEHVRAERPVVVGLPRGGVVVAAEVARALDAPLDVILVRKLGVPSQPELAMGALGEDGVRVLNEQVLRLARVSDDEIAEVEVRERRELERRAVAFRAGKPMLPIDGRTVIVVDDGIATGSTARAALHVARAHGARRVVLAAPVAPPDTVQAFAADADEVVVCEQPAQMWAIGAWYDDFTQVSDDEVVDILAAYHRAHDRGPRIDREVTIPAGDVDLEGHLTVPAGALGIVAFAHGSGSSRHSPRNQEVAAALQQACLGTLLFDLLTVPESHDRANVFDLPLLARRLAAAREWLAGAVPDLPVGYFGASTGGGAALLAAADDPTIAAVVSRGGRPDLAAPRLGDVRAPTLLVVGGHDEVVVDLNRQAAAQLRCEHEIAIVPGATHLFEEPGALDEVARLAAGWFTRWLRPG